MNPTQPTEPREPSQKPYLTEDPEKHITEAVPFFRALGCPQGFSPILTKDVKEGDSVYLMGSMGSSADPKTLVPAAYGPHTVIPQQQFPARIWLKNSKGQVFPVGQEELLIQHKHSKDTPWGHADRTTQKAPGVWFHSTPSHGGIELSPDNQTVLEKLFPQLQSHTGPQWLEEDEDAYLAVLCWPEAFEPKEVSEAWESLPRRRDHKEQDSFAIYYQSPQGKKALEIHEAWASKTASLWKAGSWSTCWPKKGINIAVTHQTTKERVYVYYEGPDSHRDYFTSEELGLPDPLKKAV